MIRIHKTRDGFLLSIKALSYTLYLGLTIPCFFAIIWKLQKSVNKYYFGGNL